MGDGGGLDASRRAQCEKIRMQAAAMFAGDVAPGGIAKRLRLLVTVRSVYRWRADVQRGGMAAVASKDHWDDGAGSAHGLRPSWR